MDIDFHFLSQQLLERLANSIYDRDSNQKDFFFSTKELQLVEEWLIGDVFVSLKRTPAY